MKCVQVTKEVFKAAGGRLKVVGRAGVGVDNVDLASATDTSLHQVHHTQLGYRYCTDGNKFRQIYKVHTKSASQPIATMMREADSGRCVQHSTAAWW